MEIEKRIADLNAGKAVVVRMNKRKGSYVDPVAQYAHDKGLLTYCGDRVFYTGHEQSPWHNPFRSPKHGTRDEVCDRFEKEVLPNLDVSPLRGRALGCWCYPERCHCQSIQEELN